MASPTICSSGPDFRQPGFQLLAHQSFVVGDDTTDGAGGMGDGGIAHAGIVAERRADRERSRRTSSHTGSATSQTGVNATTTVMAIAGVSMPNAIVRPSATLPRATSSTSGTIQQDGQQDQHEGGDEQGLGAGRHAVDRDACRRIVAADGDVQGLEVEGDSADHDESDQGDQRQQGDPEPPADPLSGTRKPATGRRGDGGRIMRAVGAGDIGERIDHLLAPSSVCAV